MERMSLLSSIFRSKKKEEKCIETPRGFQGGKSCSETTRVGVRPLEGFKKQKKMHEIPVEEVEGKETT